MADGTKIQTPVEGKIELKGIGGWLLFRICVYLFVGPVQLFNEFSYIGLTLTTFLFIAGVYLVMTKPLGVRLAKIGESLTVLTSCLLLVLPSTRALGIRGIVGGIIWLAYFNTSKRVKNTYFPPEPGSSEEAVDLLLQTGSAVKAAEIMRQNIAAAEARN
jgi:hypothetical protein